LNQFLLLSFCFEQGEVAQKLASRPAGLSIGCGWRIIRKYINQGHDNYQANPAGVKSKENSNLTDALSVRHIVEECGLAVKGQSILVVQGFHSDPQQNTRGVTAVRV